MNHKQIATCTEKLRAVDEDAAFYFERLMIEANTAAARAWELRRMAWQQYHQHFDRKQ